MMKNNYTVYVHINKITFMKYFGITCKKPKLRWDNGNGYKGCSYFWNAIQKYGWDGFDHLILFWGLTEEEAKAKEKELITTFETNNRRYGYNLTAGGDGTLGRYHSEETKKKISEANKKYYETHDNPNKGVPMSEKQKELLKAARKERFKIYGHPLLGKHHTDETKEKIKKTQIENGQTKPVICLETKNVYNSISEAARKAKCTFSSIEGVCLGAYGCKTAGGYHWQYYDDYINGVKPKEKEVQVGGKAKKVICLTTGLVYNSANEASHQTGICASSIGKCCRGYQHIAGGYEWKFIES